MGTILARNAGPSVYQPAQPRAVEELYGWELTGPRSSDDVPRRLRCHMGWALRPLNLDSVSVESSPCKDSGSDLRPSSELLTSAREAATRRAALFP
ncbi:hypothetical protein NDU88_007213 [Pleurodeles waltl]|uniref:Uncharacterized protein n=1 Tax=Pleurodeles waltl TaxID=8319 RepID=A0AAV7UN93_PLEWA|nr:hypothetical protein NDU88_007213 [Pleurodeles waltl]